MLGGSELDGEAVARITQQSNGWVAALVLLREHMSRARATLDESIGEGKDAIFQYFAGEIFNRAQPENQRVLMLTAISPSFTQPRSRGARRDRRRRAAARIPVSPASLHRPAPRRRRRPITTTALFREFLLEECEDAACRATSGGAATARAAEFLNARGQASDAPGAVPRRGRRGRRCAGSFVANALDWARQGRAQTLSDWIEALPDAMREADPWLEYWYGRAWIFVQPPRGRPPLERAYEAFRAAGDLRGQALALNTIVTGYYYEWANFAPLDRWLPEFECLLHGECAATNSIARASFAPVPRTSSCSCSAAPRIRSSRRARDAWTS